MCTQTGSQTVATGIEQDIECLIIIDEEPLRLLIGTGESHVYCYDDGKTYRVESFDQLSVREKWYTPWGGPPDVRSFARTTDGWVYADIHVGNIMRSADWGETWEPVTPDLHDDVHQVATSPRDDDRVYANTARAVYVSEDRGRSWSHRSEVFPIIMVALLPGIPMIRIVCWLRLARGHTERRQGSFTARMMRGVHGSTLQRGFQGRFRTISIRSTLRSQRTVVHGRLLVRRFIPVRIEVNHGSVPGRRRKK